jgi:demethylmenaquinone methyltransferase / 2-methoxy-6-polyprenyl-1,4-benzoquinol methylase
VQPQKPLQQIFSDIPPRYDLINTIFTFGQDRRWRRLAARECLDTKPARVLDLCCGTGELSIELVKKADRPEVFALDFSQNMLDVAAEKAKKRHAGRIIFVNADAADLPFPDGYFDSAGIAFAFRNLTYRNPHTTRYLSEVLRVLRPGGRFIIIESSQPESNYVKYLYRLYLRLFTRPLGQFISGDRQAYAYLAESAAHFPGARQVKNSLLEAGFSKVTFRKLFPGAVALHVAIKDKESPPLSKGVHPE